MPMQRVRWRRVAPRIAAEARAAPGTLIFLFVVIVTTGVLRGVDAVTVTRLLERQSTNLVQMARQAPRVLFLSAFLLDGSHLWKQVLLFGLILYPLERFVGTLRWLVAVVAGHVGATIATTLGIWLQVRGGVADRSLVYPVDVGTSYAIFAAAGALVVRLARPYNWIAAAFVVVDAGAGLVLHGTFSDWGHATALLIGFALGPLLTPPQVASPAQRSRQRRIAALSAAVLVSAALLVGAAAFALNTDVDLPAAPSAAATVTGAAQRCGRRCAQAPVRVGSGADAQLGFVRLPSGTGASVGSVLPVHADVRRPGLFRVAGTARRVDVSGLLGEIAVAALGASVALLVVARSLR